MPSTDAVIIQIADALVTDLNAETSFSQDFVAVRRYVPVTELKEKKDLLVFVCLPAMTSEILGRSDVVRRHTLQIGVMKGVSDPESANSGVDPLVLLVEEIVQFIEQHRRPATFPDAVCVDIQADPLISADALISRHEFVSVIKATYVCQGGEE